MWIFFLFLDIAFVVFIIFVVPSRFWKRALLITSFTLTLTLLASKITSTDFFSLYVYPENLALQDFDLMDYAIGNLRPSERLDSRIVIVNIGDAPRADIAREIKIISEFHPRVIGMDVLLNCEGGISDSINCPQVMDTLANKMLSEAIRNAGNVVMISKLIQKNSTSRNQELLDVIDSVEYSDPMFSDYSTNGFSNIVTGEQLKQEVLIVRGMTPSMVVNGNIHRAFSVMIAQQYDSVKARKIIERNSEVEIINFRKNIDLNKTESKFDFIDVSELLDERIDKGRLEIRIKDKIVLMGYVGNSYGDLTLEGVWYTPLNKVTYGRSLPDMFGIVLQANIISMILDEDYINVVSGLGEIIIGILACLFHVALLLMINKKFPRWFEIIAIGLVVLQLFFGSWLRLTLFIDYNIKMQLYFTMASLAIASISINICKELFYLVRNSLPLAIQKKLS